MSKSAPADRMRLQRFLSDAGVASRRHAEEYILAGRVLVNGEIVDTLPAFVDPEHDKVIVDGTPVRTARLRYFLVHKPKGVVCTTRDPARRPRAIDLLPPIREKLFPVGRLDEDSSGLLLMTNDGELTQQITHPRFGIPKVYWVETRGRVPRDLPARLREGVHLSEGRVRAAEVEVVRSSNERSILTITLREGRNRQIRRMLARFGFPVRNLKRIQIGPLELKGLPSGACRELSERELRALRAALAGAAEGPPHRPLKRPTRRTDKKTSPPTRRTTKKTSPPARRSVRGAGPKQPGGPPRRQSPDRRIVE